MKTTWVMQTNMGNQSDIKNYVDIVKETGAFVIEVNHIPFSQELQVEWFNFILWIKLIS